jgi:uncharacterized protein (TIGR00251 family)
MSWAVSTPTGVMLRLSVQSGARKSGFHGVRGEHMRIKIAAPPVDGAANEEIIKFLAEVFSVKKGMIEIRYGKTSSRKFVHIEGIDLDDLIKVSMSAN